MQCIQPTSPMNAQHQHVTHNNTNAASLLRTFAIESEAMVAQYIIIYIYKYIRSIVIYTCTVRTFWLESHLFNFLASSSVFVTSAPTDRTTSKQQLPNRIKPKRYEYNI